VLFVFFVVGSRSVAWAETPLTVGMFGLYRPQTITIQPVVGVPLVAEVDGQRESWHSRPPSGLEIKRRGEQLEIRTIGPGQTGLPRLVARVRLEPIAPAWRVLVDNKRLVRLVRGGLRFRVTDGAIQTILETDRESLVARVIASELSGTAQLESLKALAVVARTFILTSRSRHRDEGFEFCDTTHCQWYQGEDRLDRQDAFSRLVRRAVEETADVTLSFSGIARPVYFTGSCGGISTAPELVWGDGDSSCAVEYHTTLCHWCHGSKFYRWQRRIDKSAFMNALSELIGFELSPHAEIAAEITEQGLVKAVRLRDRQRCTRLAGDQLRLQVGRRMGWNFILSNAYTIEDTGTWLIFRGRGFGHNVGLCLSGAAAQARAGRGYEEILSYYFPAAELQSVDPRNAQSSGNNPGATPRKLSR
jgi:SpoIID/LytB domain protein